MVETKGRRDWWQDLIWAAGRGSSSYVQGLDVIKGFESYGCRGEVKTGRL